MNTSSNNNNIERLREITFIICVPFYACTYKEKGTKRAEKGYQNRDKFFAEIVSILQADGWTLTTMGETLDCGKSTCPELTKGNERIYCHPEELTGEVQDEKAFAEILKGAASFRIVKKEAGDIYVCADNEEGKQIYRDVYDLTIGIDEYMTACNRFVCAAVRWSGADDNYPAGDVGVQADHLYAHPEKWESVYGDTFLRGEDYRYAPPEGMQPGDVVIEYKATNYRAHTFIYCGEGLIATIYPAYADNEYVSANASWGDNMLQCTGWYRWQPYFRVFRCKQYDTNSRYKNAAL
jgi:hypothetical protein